MAGPRTIYRRFDEWARGLSRGRYALLAGIVAAVTVLVVGVVLDTSTTVQAVTMGVVLTVLYYVGNVNAEGD